MREAPNLSESDRESYYLEVLGDAHDEEPYLYVPLFWARSRFPQLPEGDRVLLAESTLLRLIDGGLIHIFNSGSDIPLNGSRAREVVLRRGWADAPGPEYSFATTPLGASVANDIPQEVWDRLYVAIRRPELRSIEGARKPQRQSPD
jgi:hypothetical protein